MAPRGIEWIYPQHQLAFAVAALGEGRCDDRASFLLRLKRHRIFEIEDQPVGGQGARLFQGSRVGAGHEEKAAARAKDSGHHACPLTMLLYHDNGCASEMRYSIAGGGSK